MFASVDPDDALGRFSDLHPVARQIIGELIFSEIVGRSDEGDLSSRLTLNALDREQLLLVAHHACAVAGDQAVELQRLRNESGGTQTPH